MQRRYPLHIHISTLFIGLILIGGSIITVIGYKLSSDMLETAATDLVQRISRETLGEINQLVAPAEMAVTVLSYDPLAAASTLGERLGQLVLIRNVLGKSAQLSAVYFSYANGDFFFVRQLRSDAERTDMKAPPGTQYMVQSIERGLPGAAADRGTYFYLNASLQVLRQDDRPDYPAAYDARTRGWYKDAIASGSMIRTAPYLFYSSNKVGTTLATRSNTGYGVIGADILLETLGASLAQQKVTPGTEVALVNAEGFVVAHERVERLVNFPAAADAQPELKRIEDFGVPVLAQLGDAVRSMKGGQSQNLRLHLDKDWRASVMPVELEGDRSLYLVIAIPEHELLAAAIRLRSASLWLTLLIIILAVPITWFAARAIVRPLRQLATEAESIRHFEFSTPITVRSIIEEVDTLAFTMDGMKRTICRFLDINAAVTGEGDFDRLLSMLLAEPLAVADADAGVLYLVDDQFLTPAAARNGDGTDILRGLPQADIKNAGPLLNRALEDGAAQTGMLEEADVAALGLTGVAAAVGAKQGIAVPLYNRRRQLVGAIMLLRRTVIEDSQLSFVRALTGSAAGVLETRELIKTQKELFEAFVKMIAGAIDAKSPYTGAHCARVPELTKMLARAACSETTGPFAQFQLDEDQWEAVHVAAWLHDCGKVTTPEYIVDKATKLETIYDRIHEVRMRFEVLKLAAENASLKAVVAGQSEADARARLAAELRQLDDDFAFVASCNEGGEAMAPEKIERLRTIAQRTWIRTLDDRIGISRDERERKDRMPAAVLPVAEPLLADKPEHCFERRLQDRIPEDNKWGIRMAVPELLYNKGELYNLSVVRGTLSQEERYKINEHIVQTLVMLNQLPFPKHLRSVPEIAGGHHEKMDGTGYPKRLTREQMSPMARMMAIADIFEALTAIDRPYKKGKTLSEAIAIMHGMKKGRHIDPDLFDLFLRAGIYRDYARLHMKPEQIDTVDVAQYLSEPAAA